MIKRVYLKFKQKFTKKHKNTYHFCHIKSIIFLVYRWLVFQNNLCALGCWLILHSLALASSTQFHNSCIKRPKRRCPWGCTRVLSFSQKTISNFLQMQMNIRSVRNYTKQKEERFWRFTKTKSVRSFAHQKDLFSKGPS